ncbi:MAG TPA: nucleotidyl transferase AbiEii/AbiGii toxin family protein [Polyangiaceae bacterium]|jgi:predicted nucleotidyltransferase|nr:nucleotidyl transferase AbiEii/AbiGii toxin family protein [Polyangiaceae bacterium]
MNDPTPEDALRDIALRLQAMGVRFALVGGLAVSIRGEARFTRDVDLALIADTDADAERIVFSLRDAGYTAIALVEHRDRPRLATARLASPSDIIVDLIVATCGIEREVVERAAPMRLEDVGEIPVARAEELLAMKVLSMNERRRQDLTDAVNLVLCNRNLDLTAVRENIARIIERGFHRSEDLFAKLDRVLSEAHADET